MGSSVGGDVFVLSFEVLALHEVRIAHIEGGLAEGVPVEVFRFYGGHVSGITRDLGYGFLLVDCLELVVNFFWQVAALGNTYPVYPGTM